MSLTIVSLNTKGLNHPAKRSSLWKTALSLKSDVLCVQETHFAQDSSPSCQYKLFPHIFKSCCMRKQRGVLIAIRNTVSFQFQKIIMDTEGRYIISLCMINSTQHTLVSLYASNQQKMSFFKSLLKKAKNLQKGHLLLCGDFNLVPDSHMDSTAGTKRHLSPLNKFIFNNNLFDVWRCCHASKHDYTYHRDTPTHA